MENIKGILSLVVIVILLGAYFYASFKEDMKKK